MNELKIDYLGGIGFEVKSRQHSLRIDLSKEKGGKDEGMNPPEVFMASLGSCVGVYCVRYCQNAKLDSSGMSIKLSWKLSDDKTKIANIDIVMSLPKAELGKRSGAVLEAAKHCLIHNTIMVSPEINISFESGQL
jgi:uncharacterized OsmC-like protein